MFAYYSDFIKVLGCYALLSAVMLAQIGAFAAVAARIGVSLQFSGAAGFTLTAAIAYSAFFAFAISTSLGFATCCCAAVALLAAAFVCRRQCLNSRVLPYALGLTVGAFYICLAYLCVETSPPLDDLPATMFFERQLPHDHHIPLMFAEAIYQRLPSRTGMDQWGWYFSDRGPLQVGYVLLFSPMWQIAKPDIVYQALGTILQASCLAGVLHLLFVICRSRSEAIFCFTATAMSGFTYFNSIYAWPKLLAAGLFFSATAILLSSVVNKRHLTMPDAVTAGGLIALAMTAHPGAAFGIIGLGSVCAWFVRRIISPRSLCGLVLAFTVIYAPWAAYVKFVDPNVNRLASINLAGFDPVSGPTPTSPPTIIDPVPPLREAIVAAYSRIDLRTWTRWKIVNAETLFGFPSIDGLLPPLLRKALDARSTATISNVELYNFQPANIRPDLLGVGSLMRTQQRDYTFMALGALNFAWPLALLIAFPTFRRKMTTGSWLFGAATILGLATYVLMMFPPASTIVTTGSYSNVLSLTILACLLAFRISETAAWCLLTLKIATDAILWVGIVPAQMWPQGLPIQSLPAVLAAAALAGIIACLPFLDGTCQQSPAAA